MVYDDDDDDAYAAQEGVCVSSETSEPQETAVILHRFAMSFYARIVTIFRSNFRRHFVRFGFIALFLPSVFKTRAAGGRYENIIMVLRELLSVIFFFLRT